MTIRPYFILFEKNKHLSSVLVNAETEENARKKFHEENPDCIIIHCEPFGCAF